MTERFDRDSAQEARADGGHRAVAALGTVGRPGDMFVGLLVASVVVVIYILGLTPGHYWGGDFAQYIGHARNIVEGVPYRATGYLFNPNIPELGPPQYPPVFPMLLSPVYLFAGDASIEPFKLVPIFCAGVFFALLYPLGLRVLSRPACLILVTFLAFSPFFWFFKNLIASDFVGLMFMAVTFMLYGRLPEMKSGWTSFSVGTLIGGALYLSFGTRTILGLMIPALVVWEILAFRRIRGPMIVGFAVAGILVGVQSVMAPVASSYLASADLGAVLSSPPALVRRVLLNVRDFPSEVLRPIWLWDAQLSWDIWVMWVVVGFGIVGTIHILWRSPTPYALFATLYAMALCGLPRFSIGTRFLLPALPFFVMAVLRGAEWMGERLARGRSLPLAIMSTGLIGLVVAGHLGVNRPEAMDGPQVREAVELFDFIEASTPLDARFGFGWPRELALYTGRSATALHHDEPRALVTYLDILQVDYLIEDRLDRNRRYGAEDLLEAGVLATTVEFENETFRVHRRIR